MSPSLADILSLEHASSVGQDVRGPADAPAHAFAGEWFDVPSRITQHQNATLRESSALTGQLTDTFPLDVLETA